MKFFNKNSIISKDLVGEKIYVYNGKVFQRKTVVPGMVGFKVGEFILTKKIGSKIHTKDLKKKKKVKK